MVQINVVIVVVVDDDGVVVVAAYIRIYNSSAAVSFRQRANHDMGQNSSYS